jgi:hypothetical protein
MERRRIAALLGAAALAGSLAAPVSAAAAPVTIDLHVDFSLGETFEAEGFCPSGEAESFGHHIVGNGRATVFHLYKTLACDDGSGTLTIHLSAAAVFGKSGTIGGWNVVSGTGDYEDARGGGHIVGTAFAGGVDDLYTGTLTR